jgi:hypothetical protein
VQVQARQDGRVRCGGRCQRLGPDPHHHLAVRHAGTLERKLPGRHPCSGHPATQQVHRRAADEAGHEQVDRVGKDLLRRPDLQGLARRHHHDPVGQGHRLHLVMGHIDGGDPQLLVQPLELGPHLDTELGVQVRQRLVEQEHRWLTDQRAPHRHPLPLPARQLRWPPFQQFVQAQDGADLGDPALYLGPGRPAFPEGEGKIAVDGHVRVQRVVLEDHRDVPVARRDAVHHLAADGDRAGGGLLQAGDQPQRCCLAAARGPHQHEELAVGHLERHVGDRADPTGELLRDLVQADLCHRYPPIPSVPCSRSRG